MLNKILMKVLATWQPTHIATTAEEREGVFRLRYETYALEQNSPEYLAAYPDGRIQTPEDDQPNATIFYVGKPDAPEATGRTILYKPGEIPDHFYETYSLHRFPDIHTRTVFEVNYFIARRDRRGTTAIVSLLSGAADILIREHGAEVLIGDCVPALLGPYRRLGLRTYGGKLVSFEGGLLVPVVGVLADVEHFRRIGSPMYPVLKKLRNDGCFPDREIDSLIEPIEQGASDGGATAIAEEIDNAFRQQGSTFLDRLPESTRSQMTAAGLMLDVTAGDQPVREGFGDQEMFLVVDGVFEVLRGDRSVATLGPGDLFGEVAFFRKDGIRSATVRAATPGRLLVLRRSFLGKLKKRSPEDAFAVYDALAAVLAERVAST